jgi:hemolysin activation/secretion protein
MPWSARQSAFYYVTYSDTTNVLPQVIPNAPLIFALGSGVTMGLRYQIDLPTFGLPESFTHQISFGLDYKDVRNHLETNSVALEPTPVTYLPISLDYTGTWSGYQSFASLRIGGSFNRTGWVAGDTTPNFEANRVGATGNYGIGSFSLDYTLRIPGLLQTLAAGHPIPLPKPDRSFADDWTLHVKARGQVASQPLIPWEEFTAGGVDSVRGYLQSEEFGDNGVNGQFEIRTPTLRNFFGGYAKETAQFVVFYDAAMLWTLNPGEGELPSVDMVGYGVGVRASLFDRFNAQIFVGIPQESIPASVTSNASQATGGTKADSPRYHIQISTGF